MPSLPYSPYRATVAPEWIDYNGHMNVAYYVLAFDRATDRLFDYLGIGEAYRRATRHSIFALEAHVTYERELREGDEFEIATQLIDADRKRLHLFHAMTRSEDGELVRDDRGHGPACRYGGAALGAAARRCLCQGREAAGRASALAAAAPARPQDRHPAARRLDREIFRLRMHEHNRRGRLLGLELILLG